MLSDEEEILIKKLRYCEQEYEQNGYLSVGKFKAIKEASNLIEKQSKEIEELKKQDLSNSKIRDKIRNRIKYLTEYYEKEVKPEMYHWGDFTAEEYYAGIIIELKMILDY